MNVAEVEQALLALDERDRAAVIHRGLLSFETEDADTDQAEVDTAWQVELRGAAFWYDDRKPRSWEHRLDH